ncbi:MAG: LacI family transcriptional regulator [Spirochaetales bacterium]|nr:LacI family transcriptional regulator [Spirochaetales bacterium]
MIPTIKDIAAQAGISYATVSRALNGKYGVSPATRRKVLELAHEMGYRPNAIAQGLVNRSTKTVGLIIPDITSPFYPRVALGIEDTMQQAGFSVFLCNTNWNPRREQSYLEHLTEKQVDGIFISSMARESREVEQCISRSMPLVYIASIPEDTKQSYVRTDNARGADLAVSHLLAQGRRRIAFIGSTQEPLSLEDRLRGYRAALVRENHPIDESLIALGEFREQSGYQSIRDMLSRGVIPDGVFAENDLLALGAVQGIQDAGFRVPQDIAVVGFDDIPMASHPDIALSTVHQPKYRIGQNAAEVMLQIFENGTDFTERRVLEPELLIRSSG